MLADQAGSRGSSGSLDADIYLPDEWVHALMEFIVSIVPAWRDDPRRPSETSEIALSARLCTRLNIVSRHSGWDFIQFKQEEPDAARADRTIDLAIVPAAQTISIEGRNYDEYSTLLPIECKRLPTPAGAKRDECEYLFSRHSSTGGVQRFKAGHHGSRHARAAMIGYVQANDVAHWHGQLNDWIDGLVENELEGWSGADKLGLVRHDPTARIGMLSSIHGRDNRGDIQIDHLWIEM